MKLLMGWLGRGLSFLLYILPPGGRKFIGIVLAFLWFDLFRIRRKVILNNIATAFPDWTLSERVRVGRASLRNMGWNLADYSLMPFLTKDNLHRYFEFHNVEMAFEAMKKEKGLLGLTLHVGAGDLALAALALRGLPVVIASKEFKLRWLNDLWFGMRARTGVRFVPPRNSSFALLKALKNNQAILIPLDQFTGPPIGVRTTFFGKETGTAAGMAVMASRSGAPVLSMYIYRKPNGMHSIHCEKFMSTEGEPQSVTQSFNDELERIVRKHPEQWMWLHKRWKKFVVN